MYVYNYFGEMTRFLKNLMAKETLNVTNVIFCYQ